MTDSKPWSINPRDSITAERGRRMFLIGPSGSGKSRLAEIVSIRMGITLFDTDAIIRSRMSGLPIGDIFANYGEEFFRTQESECIDDIEAFEGRCVVGTGGGLPAIPGMLDRLNRVGFTVYLRATAGQLWKRLSMDPAALIDRPLLKDGGRPALEALINTRSAVYNSATVVVDTESFPVPTVCDLLVDIMSASLDHAGT